MEYSDERQYETQVKAQIAKWKAEEPGVFALGIHYALSPLTWLLRQVVPEKAITAILHAADWVAEQTIPATSNASELPLSECDSSAVEVQNWAIGYAVSEGAAAGYFGILSAPVDIPAIIMLSLRAIRRIGACYGYTEADESERQFVLGILAAAGANTQEEKELALFALSALYRTVLTTTFKKMAEKAAETQFSREAAIITARNLARQVGVNLTKRRMLNLIPAIGALVGGSMNGWYVKDVGIAAQRLYQERWLRDRGLLVDVEPLS